MLEITLDDSFGSCSNQNNVISSAAYVGILNRKSIKKIQTPFVIILENALINNLHLLGFIPCNSLKNMRLGTSTNSSLTPILLDLFLLKFKLFRRSTHRHELVRNF